MSRLRINPEPLKVVSGGLREAFKPYVPPRRCDHQDGRGQCSSRDTTAYSDEYPGLAYYCAKHYPAT